MPEVSLIVHLDGGRERARRCLEALAALADEPSFEAVVVVDASPDLGELLGGLSGDVTVVRRERREGFLACAIAGAEAAGAAVLVLLRDAPLLDPGALGPLVEALADRDCAGAAAVAPGDVPTGRAVAGPPSARSTADAVDPAVPADSLPHPTAADALALRAADAGCLRAALGAPAGLELAAVCVELARRGRVVSVPTALASPARAAVAGRRAPGELAELTIVVPTLDAGAPRVRACLAAIAANTAAPHQVVLVDNGSPPQGFAAPVNAGLRAAGTPYAVVMNDDVEVMDGWWEPLRAALDAGAAVVFPQTVDGLMREDFAAWCFGLTAETIAAMSHGPGEFFDPELRIWFQDSDLLVRLRALGRPPLLVRSSHIRHALSATVRSEDPALRRWIEETIAADRAAFERKHPTVSVV
ncbi:MAG TPA: glycosyltransferase family 2 protein [Solirubrobacterales bacterium]|nr:glycosyltransferase family 2 protein [Solirubrobacterales bacterium]